MQVVSAPANAAEAHMLAHVLGQHGIEAHVMGAQLQGAVGDLPSGNFVRVMVADEDFERARRLIVGFESAHCPPAETGSGDRRRSWVPLTAIVLLGIMALGAALWLRAL